MKKRFWKRILKILPLSFRIESSRDEGSADIVTLLSLDDVEDQLWGFWSGDKDVLVCCGQEKTDTFI